VNSDIVQFDLEGSRNRRVTSEIIDLLFFSTHYSMSSTISTITRGAIAAMMLLTVTSRTRSMSKS